ncbi:Tn3 transposase DDE domain-containing protein [Nitrosovibrio tenuis]|uniref:Tn3 transposase DDE domain-containing protein n=1 Tax=Nitrosovibrio tenuis TaxID=1233 RepID=A0A1H7N0W9_9PROT|nr:Tn3 transposase DDE domain-containing protein [Nitrosovibrio tenuis]
MAAVLRSSVIARAASTLWVAAIVLWNTIYLERVAQTLREPRKDVNDTLLPHVSPLGW